MDALGIRKINGIPEVRPISAVFIHIREMKTEADSGYKINVEIQ